MSVIDLEIIKARLHLMHGFDDVALQQMVDSAEDEAVRYLNREQLPTLPQDYPSSSSSEDVPSDADPVAPSVIEAICLLVKAAYEATTPAEVAGYRAAAEVKLHPYRVGLGA